MASHVDFEIFDCDNHYYEAIDAFTRHIEPRMAKRAMQWARDRRQDSACSSAARSTASSRTRPSTRSRSRARSTSTSAAATRRARASASCSATSTRCRPPRVPRPRRPPRSSWTSRASRRDLPAHARRRHGAGAASTTRRRWSPRSAPSTAGWTRTGASPTRSASSRAPLLHARRPRRRRGRAASGPSTTTPASSCCVPGPVITPAGRALARRPGVRPVLGAASTRRASPSSCTAATAATRNYLADWGESAEMEAFRQNPFRSHRVVRAPCRTRSPTCSPTACSTASRTCASRRSRPAPTGCSTCFEKLKKSYGQTPHAYPEDPRETFTRHVWVSPYYEDDLAELRDLHRRRPHPVGLRLPARRGPGRAGVVHQGPATTSASRADDARLVMRDNGLALSQRRPA